VPRDFRREQLDMQLAVKEEGADFCRGHQVLQIVMRRRDRGKLVFQFRVDRLKFLVHGLEFFLTRLQFLRRRAIFFVDRLQFFVGCPQLLYRLLMLGPTDAEAFLSNAEFLPQLAIIVRTVSAAVVFCARHRLRHRPAIEKEHECSARRTIAATGRYNV